MSTSDKEPCLLGPYVGTPMSFSSKKPNAYQEARAQREKQIERGSKKMSPGSSILKTIDEGQRRTEMGSNVPPPPSIKAPVSTPRSFRGATGTKGTSGKFTKKMAR